MAVRMDLTHLDGSLADNEVHVWRYDYSAHTGSLDSSSQLLDQDEHDRTARFIVPAPCIQFVLSRAFLRTTLGRYLGVAPREVQFRTAEHGKPELADGSDLKFNLSHTDGTTVVAVTRARRIGIDVEKVRENLNPLEMGDRFFSKKEAEWLRSRPESERCSAFFACWAAKESYIKAWGEGLSMPLADFGIIPQAGNTRLQLDVYGKPELSRDWSIWQLDLGPNLRSAVAVENPECRVRLGRWAPGASSAGHG